MKAPKKSKSVRYSPAEKAKFLQMILAGVPLTTIKAKHRISRHTLRAIGAEALAGTELL